MKYNPDVDKDVGVVCADEGFVQIRNVGALSVLASQVLSIKDFKVAVSASSACDIVCDSGIVAAMAARTHIMKICSELCIRMPINLVVECSGQHSVDSILFVAHGAFDEIKFVICEDDAQGMQRKAFSVVSDVNDVGHKMTKYFGYKTRIVVRAFFKEINKEIKQAAKRVSSLIGDPRLCEIEVIRELELEVLQPDEDGCIDQH